ncbi:MAG: DUF624 domain-containing protein [Oscillospiraceae bacterium]|nr:DUF624 domain-containing protein [Oscillospiraceae bacterium]
MGLFYNYENSGAGVAKNAPKKKPFFRFWEQFFLKFWKILFVNIIFFAFSGLLLALIGLILWTELNNNYFLLLAAPMLILFGPATAASMQVMRKFVLEKPIFLFDEFKKAYRDNFRQALPVGIFDVLFTAVFAYGVVFYTQMLSEAPSAENYILMIITTAIAVYVFLAHFYIYLEIVSLTLPIGKIVKNALLLTIMGIKVNIINFAVSLLFLAAIILFFPYSTLFLAFIPFGWLMFLYAFNCYPVIQKYIINPFYESRGERNPELPEEEEKEERIFTDRGGSEPEIRQKRQAKGFGRIIK